MFGFNIMVAAPLGIPTATTIVNIILNAGALVTVLGIISSIVSGGATTLLTTGATTLLTTGWAAFKATVQRLAKQSMARAIAY